MSKKAGPFLKNILVGTDFSLCAARAFSFAASLAASQGAKIHLVHVLVEPVQAFDVAGALPYLDASTQRESESREKAPRGRRRLGREARRQRDVRVSVGPPVGRDRRDGREDEGLARRPRHARPQRAREAPHRLPAERVVRLCPVPVLTVREKR